MDVDEELPGPSRASEDKANQASSVSQRVELTEETRALSDASLDNETNAAAGLDNEKNADAGLPRAWTEDGWHTVLSRRQKKKNRKSEKEPEKETEKKNGKSPGNSSAATGGEIQTKRDFRRRKRRGPPPLPKEDIKVILRPHKGLIVKNLLGSELSVAVIEACRNNFGGDSFLLRVHPGSNIVILSTPHEQVAGRLREISQLKIRGQIHPFNAYVADPEDVLRGIVHGLPPGTTQAELMANLRIRTQGVNIERARMLGSSKSAIITFTGNVLPRCVYFMGAEAICYPYKPTIQVCKICRSTGHRTDVCPTPNANVCSKCGASNPSQGHECIPNCAICGEEHATGDTSCRKKLKNVPPRISRVEQPRRKTEWTNKESEFPQLEQQRQKPHRWFSSEREEAAQQSRQGSRSPSRSRSRSRSQQQPTTTNRPEETPGKCNMKKISSSSGEKSSPQAGKAEDEAAAASRTTNQVSWVRVVSPSAPITDNHQYRKIIEENKRLTQQIKQLRNQMTAERKEYQLAISSMEKKFENAIKTLQTSGSVGNPNEGKKEVQECSTHEEKTETSEGMGEDIFGTPSQSSELIQQVQTQVQENREGIANINKLLGDFMTEIKAFVGEELRIQRQYVNEAVGGLQRAINKRPLSTPVSDKPSKAGRDDADTPMQHGQK